MKTYKNTDITNGLSKIKNLKLISKRLGKLLMEQKKTLSTAESCTGGMISKVITDIPGSSRYFAGGVVSYSNDIKNRILHVDKALLNRYGAVSQEVALAMLKGVQRLMKTDCAIAVTGIAGPDGGTPEKPVGLVYIAVANKKDIQVKRFVFQHDRDGNRKQTTITAITILIEMLNKV
ncbi:MAG: CinA family protein [bacterium]